MSKYTTELRYICEEQAGRTESVDYNSTASVIEAARSHIFNFTYPYYDADQKQRTETNILRHFYTMEIGEETYGLWKMRLEDKMNLIMPYYVKMFETAALEFDPLVDVDLRETLDEDTAAYSEGSSNVTNSSVQNDNNSSEVITDQDDSVNRTHSAFNSDNRSGNDETKISIQIRHKDLYRILKMIDILLMHLSIILNLLKILKVLYLKFPVMYLHMMFRLILQVILHVSTQGLMKARIVPMIQVQGIMRN